MIWSPAFSLSNESIFVSARADYEGEKGSSCASPRMAAVIANYLAETPDATGEDIRRMLKDAVRDLGEPGYDTVFGWGYLPEEE